MCGFTGVIDPNGRLADLEGLVRRMAETIAHRGPDDSGAWVAPNRRVALAFRRLSIQDLSQYGHQPMFSASGRWCICFNGEVYNFITLRKELEPLGHRFKGGSDTEVILACIEQWGVRAAIEKMVGMFAMALWDLEQNELWLIRDRFGVKPLYFGCPGMEDEIGRGDGGGKMDHVVYFGSELKALRSAWGTAPSINHYALQLLLRYQYVPAPWTLWNGIRKLMPGHIFRYKLETRETELFAYWSAGRALVEGAQNPLKDSPADVAAQIEAHIDQSVRDRIIADVPLGAFLSGGIDSALVVAAMQRCSSSQTRTFTIGSHDKSIDESNEASRVAQHLGTEHHSLCVGLEEAKDPILRLGELGDEPLGDASFIPTYLVSKFARSEVTVILSGDGGDEMFAGYPQHRFASKVWPWQQHVPGRVAAMLQRGLLDPTGLRLRSELTQLAARGPRFLDDHMQQRAAKALRVLGTPERAEFMGKWRNLVARPEDFLMHHTENEPPLLVPDIDLGKLGAIRAECWADIVGYMPNDILLKVDRASMDVSLEAREPLLDHRLFEFSARIPDDLLVREGRGKWILREALYRSVPKHLVDAPKRGFALPVAGWVIGPLRDWAESLLAEDRLREQGLFKPHAVRAAWDNLISPGQSPYRLPFFGIWSILAFQAWLERWN